MDAAPRPAPWSLAAVGVVILLGHLSLYPRIADLDGFYHLGHAAAYLEGSPLDTSFPWVSQSVIGERGADIWWGFHVLLIPFATLDGIEWGVRLAALTLTLVLAASFLGVLRRHHVRGAGWWTVGLLVAVPNVFFRFVMPRPHVLSLAVALVLLSVLARGRWWQALAASAAVTWLHLSLFWMPVALVAAYAVVRAGERVWSAERSEHGGIRPVAAVGAVLIGSAMGWALRPHPLDAAALAGVQIVRLFAERAADVPLPVSAELSPLPFGELLRSAWLFLAVWLGSVALVITSTVRQRPSPLAAEERTLLSTSLLVSAAFLVLALFSARRALVEWTGFGAFALPLAWGALAPDLPRVRARMLAGAGALLLGAHLSWGAWRHMLNVDLVAFPPDTMAGPAAYLARTGEPGDVVFHAKWDNFGPLFARNRESVYLGGMDPIFQLAHDVRRYWEFFYLSADLTTEWTCDAFPCVEGTATDTHRALREHFGARWVVVEPRRNPRLSLYLLEEPRFALRYETQREAVFEVLPGSGRSPAGAPPP